VISPPLLSGGTSSVRPVRRILSWAALAPESRSLRVGTRLAAPSGMDTPSMASLAPRSSVGGGPGGAKGSCRRGGASHPSARRSGLTNIDGIEAGRRPSKAAGLSARCRASARVRVDCAPPVSTVGTKSVTVTRRSSARGCWRLIGTGAAVRGASRGVTNTTSSVTGCRLRSRGPFVQRPVTRIEISTPPNDARVNAVAARIAHGEGHSRLDRGWRISRSESTPPLTPRDAPALSSVARA
jgi:hypothetical protein